MWTGWAESYTGPSQVSASISIGESGRSRSDRGTYTHIQKSGRGDQICLIHRLLCLLARSCMTLSSLWTWCWVYVCVQTPQTLFSFPLHLWFLLPTLDSREPVSDTGGNVSNYRGSVCEGHACMSVFVRAGNCLRGICRIPPSQKKKENLITKKGQWHTPQMSSDSN